MSGAVIIRMAGGVEAAMAFVSRVRYSLCGQHVGPDSSAVHRAALHGNNTIPLRDPTHLNPTTLNQVLPCLGPTYVLPMVRPIKEHNQS